MTKTTNKNKIATEKKKTPVSLSTLVHAWTCTTSQAKRYFLTGSDSTSTPFLMGWDSTSTPTLAERTPSLLYSARQQPDPPDCSLPWALPPGSPLERLPGVQPTGLRASPTAACGSLQSSMAAARTPDSEKQGTDSVAAQTYHTHTKRNSKWYFKSLGTPQIPDEPANVRCPPKKEPPLKSQDAGSPKKP